MRIIAILGIFVSAVIFLTPFSFVLALESTGTAETVNVDELQADPGAVDVGEALIPPTSPLYFLKTLREKIELALTFSQEGKVVRQLEFAQRRLREVRTLVKDKHQDLISTTMVRYRDHIDKALAAASKSGDLQVKVGEAISRHLDVLQRVYDEIGNESAKEAVRDSIERAEEQNRLLLEKLDTVAQQLLIRKTALRQALACKFMMREASSSALNDTERAFLKDKVEKCKEGIRENLRDELNEIRQKRMIMKMESKPLQSSPSAQ